MAFGEGGRRTVSGSARAGPPAVPKRHYRPLYSWGCFLIDFAETRRKLACLGERKSYMKSRVSIIGAVVLSVTVLSLESRAAVGHPAKEQAKPQSGVRKDDGEQASSTRRRAFFWRDPAVVKDVGLEPNQINQIDQLWHAHFKELSPRVADLQRQEAELKRLILGRKVDPDVLAMQIDRVEAQRTILYKSRTLMLYRMALVLTPEQNAKLEGLWLRLFFETNDGRGDSREGRDQSLGTTSFYPL